MNAAATLGEFQRPEHALGRSFALSAFVHIALAAVLFLGVHWQVHAPDTVTVDLVPEAPLPPPPAAEAPKPPPPKPEPVVKPEPPPIKKPDIAVAEKPKPKPEPKKVAPKPKPDPEFKKRQLEEEKRVREQVAMEQKALEQQNQERALRELLAKQQAQAAAARQSALNEYVARIQAKVRGNWILPAELHGNPEAIFIVVQLPTGEVLSTRLIKSSGNPSYDNAVERAILKSSPLPLPAQRELFSRELKLTFRPQDK